MDVSNRPYLIWKVTIPKPKLGEMDTELFKEWFQAFAQNAGVCLHIENLYADNSHHIVETCFKGLARALRQAVTPDERLDGGVALHQGQSVAAILGGMNLLFPVPESRAPRRAGSGPGARLGIVCRHRDRPA